jgi:hypothetical protein
MAKRHNDALAISMGACNPSGIALSIVDACREIRDEPNYGGTDMLTSDPAVKLMVSQLSFIVGNGEMGLDQYNHCMVVCRAHRDLSDGSRTVSTGTKMMDDTQPNLIGIYW